MTEQQFNQLIKDRRAKYLDEIDYQERLARHRYPAMVKQKAVEDLGRRIIRFQQKAEIQDIDPDTNALSYATSIVNEIWKEDKRLRTLYNTVKQYCILRGKDFNLIAPLVAEYRALNILFNRIKWSLRQVKPKTKHQMTKKYTLERREPDGMAPYLKVYLQEGADHDSLAILLTSLSSVRTANVTKQANGKRDLTVYPSKAYDIKDTQTDVDQALTAYFAGSPVDPTFKKDPISGMSDKAYTDILDHLLIFGKNLETSIRLSGKMDEETCRDHFVTHLNAISNQYSTKGEVYNRQGKTDILVSDHNGNNIFIGECKLWKGESYLTQAIDQLLTRYINWRDEKTALIIFNQDVQNFSGIVDTANNALKSHPNFVKFLGQRKDTSYSYLFNHKSDPNKLIKLELILFNFI